MSQGSASNLTQAARMLSMVWDETKEHWRDVRSHEFEQKYLDDLPSQVAVATAAMEEIELLLKRVRSDCE